MIAFWDNKTHPITGYKFYNSTDNKKFNDKNYVPKNKYTTDIELGVDMKSGLYRAVYSFGKTTVKKIILGKYKDIEDARKKYLEYMNIKSKYKDIYFSRTKFKFFFKINGQIIWSLTRESDDDFVNRISDLYTKKNQQNE